MFGVDTSELILVAVLALIFIGPKDLPHALRAVGRWIGQVRGMARHFRSGLDTMMREAELEEMEKKWKADNERIMRENPLVESDWGQPGPAEPDPVKPLAPPAPRALPDGNAPPIPPSGAAPPAPSVDLP